MADPGRAAVRPTRPLPIGAFPLPFGFLLLPPGAATEPARQALLAGRLPELWPAPLRGHRAALAGDLDAARAAFGGQDPVSRFNRFVLDPDGASPDDLRAALGDPLCVLVDLVLFAAGRTDTVPVPPDADGELTALVLAARSALAVLAGDPAVAIALLSTAVATAIPSSPALAGVLHGALGQAHKLAGQPRAAIGALQGGISLLAGTDLAVGLAEQHLELAATYHELAADQAEALAKAVHHYHGALQAADREQAPEVFAAAHAGLAAAYLTMPMARASDQLRYGIAVSSLRAALTVYTRDSHPAQWASAQLNLANALVYAPSGHRADNVAEAVELYEAVLGSRSRRDDPLGYARALANQGNALAHLGMFDQARTRLAEAGFLFEESYAYDAVASVRGLADEIASQAAARSTPIGDAAAPPPGHRSGGNTMTTTANTPGRTRRSAAAPAEPSFEHLARAVDDAAAAVALLGGEPRHAAEELRAAIEAAHKAALVTIVGRLRADDAGRALLYELLDDPLIRLIFSLHGIIRLDSPASQRAPLDGTSGLAARADPAFIPLSSLRRRAESASA